MKKAILILLCVSCGVVFVGCASMGEKTKTGAIAGGLIGAAAGGIIGHQSGHGLEGAAIGAGIGALGGGLIGNQMDKKATVTNSKHLSIVEIVDMVSKSVSDDVIIDEIKKTKSQYDLSSEAITYLKDNGVSDKVIDVMLAMGN